MPDTALPSSIDDTLARLAALDYVADRQLATCVFLALKLQRPLFLEGEPGTGKTEIARTLAAMLGRPLIRLQCYEGLDLAGATVPADGFNTDLHASAEYRAALVPVLAARAVG